MGSRMTAVAVPVQLYLLTHSSFAVGSIGLALALPLISLGLLGGSLADAMDRRKLVLITGSLLAAVSLAFAAQAFLDLRQAWLLYVLTVLQSSAMAVDQPARRTFIPRLLPSEGLPAAYALQYLSGQLAVVAGPLIAGFLIAGVGLQWVYMVDAASFIVGLYAVFRLPPVSGESVKSALSLRAALEGLRFIRHRPVIATVLLADLNATIFGMPFALFPALAATHFGGLRWVGVLYAAPAVGGVIAAALSGPVSHIERQGLAVLLSIGVWGAAIAAFGFTQVLPLAVVLLAIAGAADVVNGVFRSTLVQVDTPDELQGRVGSVAFVVGTGGPELGNFEAGAVAQLTSPATSAVLGGLASLVGVIIIGLASPALARYRGTGAL